MMESIAAASMSMSQMEFANAYDMAILKKSMESMEAQAETLINDMLAAVPAPSQYGFDVYECSKWALATSAPRRWRQAGCCLGLTGHVWRLSQRSFPKSGASAKGASEHKRHAKSAVGKPRFLHILMTGIQSPL